MNEDNNNNFILVDEDKPKEKKWKKIVKILLVVAIVCSFVMNGYVFYNMMSSSNDSTTTVTNKGTVKQVNYDVKTDTTSVVEKASDSVVGVVVYKNTTNNAFGFGDNSSSSSETQSGSGSGVVYDQTGKYTYIITNHHVIDGANKVQVVFSNNEYVDAEVVGSDEYSDVAILRCQPSFDVSVIDLGDSDLLDKGETVLAIEDPVERKLNRINQMQVNTMSGLTFDRGLRALMRQDPDVIMVGETRDKETAEISVRAAITGHLVVSTLHTNDAISTIVRLEEMGVEPYMVANSLVGVVAQRLMRKVCPYCKKEVATSLSDRLALQEGIKYISKGTGCPHCNQTGYKGRIAIHEVIEIDSKVRKMISNQEEIDDIMKYLVEEQGVETLRDQALKLVKEGKTTVDEFNKIIAYID